MSEEEDERHSDGEESFSQLELAPNRIKKSLADLRQPRQKFCPRWENEFPWLKANNVNESVGSCTICDKQLVCKKSHLERHEKSFKHRRLAVDSDMQPTQPEFLECGKREMEDDEEEFDSTIELEPEYKVEFELNPIKKRKRKLSEDTKDVSDADSPKNQTPKLDRFKLLRQIDRDRNELNSFYYTRLKQESGLTIPPIQISRDSTELFFDSISASVKQLPPKLTAEFKSRISQTLAEFELRAICEREALEIGISSEMPVMVASTTHDLDSNVEQDAEGLSGVPQIMYTYRSTKHVQ